MKDGSREDHAHYLVKTDTRGFTLHWVRGKTGDSAAFPRLFPSKKIHERRFESTARKRAGDISIFTGLGFLGRRVLRR